jgi:hypothetical protein
MNIYHFIYKTIHNNGKYYIGRHTTENINDGYLGSGKWVDSIIDKSTLTRSIIEFATDIEKLKQLEEQYIDVHFDDPMCMNATKSSCGFSSDLAKKVSSDRVKNGTHPWQKRSDGSSFSRELQNKSVIDGTHHFLKRSDGSSIASDNIKERLENGTFHLLRRSDGSSLTSDKVKEGTHHFLRRPDGSSVSSDRVKNGTHPWQKRSDGSSLSKDRVKNGTCNLLKKEDGNSIGSEICKKRMENKTHNFITNHPHNTKVNCPHCNKTVSKPVYGRHHGDKCKQKSL